MPPSFRKLTDSWYPGYRGTLGTGAFTLIELLITISILAILGSAISIVLNPAELLAEARDSQRINDLESLRNSLSLTLIDNPSLFDSLSNTSIYLSLPSSSCLTNPPSGYTYICNAASLNLQKTDSSGWLPLSLTNLPVFPIDPVNSSSSSLYYAFVPDSTNKTFVLTSLLESEKYLKLSALKDGGTDPSRIEEGNPSLWTSASGLVGYWPMDEGAGTTANDLSGNGNTLTIGAVGTNVDWTAGKSGMGINVLAAAKSALTPCPTSAYANIGSSNILYNLPQTGFTFSIWYKLSSGPTVARFNTQHTVSGSFNGFYMKTDYINVANSASTNTGLAPNMSANNNWHNFTYIFDILNNTQNAYKDGVLTNSATNLSGSYGNISKINFGIYDAGWCGAGHAITGILDDARIYNRVLSASEVGAIYSAQK